MAFMPPEQAEGRLDQVGIASDVFALGATLYALLTGRRLTTARTCWGRPAVPRVRAGQVIEAVAEIAEMTNSATVTAAQWYEFACIYALASGKTADRKRGYADRAMELLHKAVKAGYHNATNMAEDSELDVLRQRDDFKKAGAVAGAADGEGACREGEIAESRFCRSR